MSLPRPPLLRSLLRLPLLLLLLLLLITWNPQAGIAHDPKQTAPTKKDYVGALLKTDISEAGAAALPMAPSPPPLLGCQDKVQRMLLVVLQLVLVVLVLVLVLVVVSTVGQF